MRARLGRSTGHPGCQNERVFPRSRTARLLAGLFIVLLVAIPLALSTPWAQALVFERATAEIAATARMLLASLVTEAEPRSREVEAFKAKARSAQRLAVRD